MKRGSVGEVRRSVRQGLYRLGRPALASALVMAVGAAAVQGQGRSRFACLDLDKPPVSRIVGRTKAPRKLAPSQVSLQLNLFERRSLLELLRSGNEVHRLLHPNPA